MRTVSHSEFGRLFRAKVKVSSREKWLILSFEWKFILEVKSGGLHLHGLPARVDSVRSTLLAFGAGIPTILVLLWTWGYLNSYLLSISSDGTVLIAAVSSFIFFFTALIFGMLGMLYLLDFLTIRLQSRYALDLAILKLKEVRLGRFRHTLRVSVEKEINLPGYKGGGDFLLLVAATRRGLRSALGPFLPTIANTVQ